MAEWNAGATWFDAVVLTSLVWGAWRGQRLGLSEKLVPLVQWGLILGLGVALSPGLGEALSRAAGMGPAWAVAAVYGLQAGLLKVLCFYLQQWLSSRHWVVVHFGKSDHGLGLVAGLLHTAAGLIFVLALAGVFDTRPFQARLAVRPDDEDLDTLVATVLVTLHGDVVNRSWSGRVAREHLGGLLLSPEPWRRGPRPLPPSTPLR